MMQKQLGQQQMHVPQEYLLPQNRFDGLGIGNDRSHVADAR